MALARWQATIVDEAGNIQDGAMVTVRQETSGTPLASLFSDRDGLVPTGNPVTADADGYAFFHVVGGAYQITATKGSFTRTWRYVALGTMAEQDSDTPSLGNLGVSGFIDLSEIAAPANPDANVARLYAFDDGGATRLGIKDAAGIVASIGSGQLALPSANASIELGSGTANTPFIDFHSSANVVDYDTRLIASGGDATLGGGTLTAVGTFGITPRADSLKLGLSVAQTGSGSTGGGAFRYNYINVSEDDADGGSGASKIDALQIDHIYGGSSMRGGRHGLEVFSILNFPSHVSNPDRNYVGGAFTGLANSHDGGGSGTEQGAFFGINAQAAAFTGATFLLNLTGGEFNTAVHSGASVKFKTLIQLAGRDDDVVQGSTVDAMLALTNQTTAVKWEDGILITGQFGSFPIDTSGSILRATAGTVTKGIDLSALTISGNAFASPNFTLAGTGNITMGAQLTTGAGISTGDASMEIGGSRTGDGNVYIDFHATSGSDYECRFLRLGGTNGAASFANKGTGDFSFTQEGAGALSFKTSNAERLRIASGGVMQFAAPSFAANGAGTVTISNLRPAGAATATITRWLTFNDENGVDSYIPVWQ